MDRKAFYQLLSRGTLPSVLLFEDIGFLSVESRINAGYSHLASIVPYPL